MKIQVRQTSPSSSVAEIREHRITIDRPKEKEGTDLGPMGGELFLASIGGCFMSTLLAAVRSRGAAIHNLATEVNAVLEGTPARFTSIELSVSGEAEDPEVLAHLVGVAERGCIMLNTLQGRLPVNVRVQTTTRA